jgi:Prolyl oligopeptidase family
MKFFITQALLFLPLLTLAQLKGKPTDTGHGYPGRLLPYQASGELAENMKRYDLSGGWYVRDTVASNFPDHAMLDYYQRTRKTPFPDRIAYLLYSPKKTFPKPLPLVLFISGCGETGEDLNRQFRHRDLFEKVTSKAFQDQHPCYLLALSPPAEFMTLMGGEPGHPTLAQNLMNDALLVIARAQKKPPVDLNRLYATGLSYGGGAVYAFGMRFPGRFAAIAPVAAGVMYAEEINETLPGNWFHFCNEGDYERRGVEWKDLESFQSRVMACGGDFRIGTFPDGGHNAWSKAWSEEAAWDWMFSKTADNKPVSDPRANKSPSSKTFVKPNCMASVPGSDPGSGPERGADGLMATAYVSTNALRKGDYWLAEYPEPVSGRLTLSLGDKKKGDTITHVKVEVSSTGNFWDMVLQSKGKREASVVLHRKIRFIRVTVMEEKPGTMVIRELELE